LQIGAAADRLGLGQSSNASRSRTDRGRASASADGSSDDEKVLGRVVVKAVVVQASRSIACGGSRPMEMIS